jgi:hypothetical protein
MKLRTRRLSIATTGVGAVFVTVLVVANWSSVHDHLEAWYFQFTRETKMLEPMAEGVVEYSYQPMEHLLQQAANDFRSSVIFDPKEMPFLERSSFSQQDAVIINSNLPLPVPSRPTQLPEQDITALLKKAKWRVLKEDFPRRAYILIRAADHSN